MNEPTPLRRHRLLAVFVVMLAALIGYAFSGPLMANANRPDPAPVTSTAPEYP